MKKKLVNLVVIIYKSIFLFLGFIIPKNKNMVVFESFFGKQYSDNPRAIYEYLSKEKPDFQLYWSFDKRYINKFKHENIVSVKRFSLKWLFIMTRAKFWVNNCRLPLWIPKSKNTIYIQTWHGTPLKKLAADLDEVYMAGTETTKYKQEFLEEADKWDYLISPNEYSTNIFKSAFNYKKEIIESGYPRNDFLINCDSTDTVLKVKSKLKLPNNKKVILYAPTWRDDQYYSQGQYKFTLHMDLHRMRKALGEDYIILMRLHYLIAENIDLSDFQDFIYDMSNYEDIRELYLVSDMLITDYSSVFFDYANLKKPILFYVYDIEDYRDKLRGFYFDIEQKAPGPLVKTTEGLIESIKWLEKIHTPSREIEEFYNKFCYLEDGNSSKRVVEKMLSNLS